MIGQAAIEHAMRVEESRAGMRALGMTDEQIDQVVQQAEDIARSQPLTIADAIKRMERAW